MYMFCETVFSNANLKPSKVQEHFDNRHGGAKCCGTWLKIFAT